MPLSFRFIPNLASHVVKEIDAPWQVPRATFKPKGTERIKWAVAAETDHVFLSMYEGLHPGMRVSASNEAVKMWGVLADYDCDTISDSMLADAAQENPSLAPTWTTRSMSPGRARLIWQFSEGIWLPPAGKPRDSFLKKLAHELGLADRLPSYDPASLIPTQVFEVGWGWKPTGFAPLPVEIVALWLAESAKRSIKAWGQGELEIPLEEVSVEVEKRWPGRWQGAFMEGARGPLFFVEPFEDRVGCQVASRGLICYSTRAPGAFVSWSDLLGKDFARKWEADRTGAVAQDIWYDSKSYWWKVGDNVWASRNKEDSLMHLKGRGFSAKTESKQTISDAERVLLSIQENRMVDFAAPLLFEGGEIVDVSGERVLNISRRRPMEPAESGSSEQFPWLWEYLNKIWDDWTIEGLGQRDYFFAWLKRFWQTAWEGRPAQGHLLVLAGPVSAGKTFLNKCIIGEIMGGSVDACGILQGTTDFNKQAGEMAVWRIDDGTSLASAAGLRKFGEILKKHIANPTVTYQPKYKDAIELPYKGRIVITCNTDPDSLEIIPPLDNNIKDKVMLLKFSDTWRPVFSGTNKDNEERVMAELPFFLAWLRDWKPPAATQDDRNARFGVVAIHHPEMLSAAREASPTHSIQEALDIWRKERKHMLKDADKADADEWCGSASKLLTDVRQWTPEVAQLFRQTSACRLGKDLRKLLDVWEPLIKITNVHGVSFYHISLS